MSIAPFFFNNYTINKSLKIDKCIFITGKWGSDCEQYVAREELFYQACNLHRG